MMKNIIFAGAAALALTAVPAAADDHMDGEAQAYVLTADQDGMYQAWPPERRSAYDAWPYNIQEYYWTLDAPQQTGWWMLNDTQRTQVFSLTPEQRAQAWTQINAQMAGNDTAMAATSASATAPRFVRSEVTQTTPSGYTATASGTELPICSPDQEDGCINAWEAGKRGPGVNRPLEYWPGRPASEIDEPLPATRPEDSDS